MSYTPAKNLHLSGDVTTATPTSGDNDTSLATTAFVLDATGSASSNRPVARVGRTTAYAVPSSAANSAIPFDQEQLDTDNMVTVSGTTDRITCVTPGAYVVTGNLGWSSNSGGTSRGVRIAHYNSAGTLQKAYTGSLHSGTGASTTASSTATAVVSMVAGDYVRLEAYQDIVGTLNTAVSIGTDHANLSAAWVGGTGAAWGNAGAQVYGCTTSIANASETMLSFASETYDIDGMHSTSSNTSRLTCVTPGTYKVQGKVYFTSAAASGPIYIALYKNGASVTYETTSWVNSAAIATTLELNHDIPLSAGDYIEIAAYQNTGATRALDISAGRTFLSALRVGYQTNPTFPTAASNGSVLTSDTTQTGGVKWLNNRGGRSVSGGRASFSSTLTTGAYTANNVMQPTGLAITVTHDGVHDMEITLAAVSLAADSGTSSMLWSIALGGTLAGNVVTGATLMGGLAYNAAFVGGANSERPFGPAYVVIPAKTAGTVETYRGVARFGVGTTNLYINPLGASCYLQATWLGPAI